ncbi:MAG: glycine oxidase ThiO [Candidatus Baltobacteraceae bacterium]
MIVVIGAGLIGLAIAYELAKRGADVRVLESREPGGAASWAGAGMLAPYTESEGADEFERFCADSLALFPAYAQELRERGGVDSHLRLDGLMEVARDGENASRLRAQAEALARRGVRARWLDFDEMRSLEPALGVSALGASLVEDEGQIDNRRLGRALLAACAAAGVRVEAQAGNVAIEADARRVLGVRTSSGFLPADAVVNAAGAWAGELEGVPAQARVPVVPVKGQMLALAMPKGLVTRVVWIPGAYLVPRREGRLLIGATAERAGFDVRVTAGGVRRLLDAALSALPALRELALCETWAGLRPGSPDGRPFIGETSLGRYFVATGHYRNGILLAPATARVVADALEGKPPRYGPETFAPSRAQEPLSEAPN